MYNIGKQDGKCEALDLLLQEINAIASEQHD